MKDKIKDLNKRFLVFSSLFRVSSQLETVGGKFIEDSTFKQWYFMLILNNLFEKPPTLSECAQVVGCSHQNAKQIASKLVDKGYLKIEKDKSDSRVIRLTPTLKYKRFSEKRLGEDQKFIAQLFSDISLAELEAMIQGFIKIEKNLQNMQIEDKAINE